MREDGNGEAEEKKNLIHKQELTLTLSLKKRGNALLFYKEEGGEEFFLINISENIVS